MGRVKVISMQNEAKKATNFRSIATTLTISFLALSLTILLISSGLQAYFSYIDRQNVVADQQYFIANEAAEKVRKFIDVKFNILGAASDLNELTVINKEEQKLILNKLLGFDPSFRQVALLNADRQKLGIASRLSTSESEKLMKRVGNDLVSQVSMGKDYISPVYIDDITGEPMVVMAVPVTDVFGDFKGLLVADVNLKFMWDLVDKIQVGSTGTAYVVDRQGNLLAYSDVSRVLKGENLMRLVEVSHFVNNPGLLTEKDYEVSRGIMDTDVVSNFISLGTPDWAVITELPVTEAYEPIIQRFRITVLIVIANIILVIFIAVSLSKRITKPIIMLSDAANEIGKGNLGTSIEVRSDDEIGQLASNFNKMTGELQRTTISKQTLQTMLDSMPYGIILIGMDKKILNSNYAALEMMGYESEEEIAGLICNTIICPADDDKCPIIDLKQKIDRSEKILITKDGRRIPILKSVVPVKLGDREVLLEAFVDISESKQAEEALRQSEEKHRMLIENIQDGVFIIHDGALQFVNEAFAGMLGYTVEEVVGRDFHEFIAPEDLEMVVDRYQRRQAGENLVREYEFRMLHRDGKTRIIVKMYMGLIDYRGRMASMGTIKDITELKRAEDIQRENERLALMSRSKAEFLLNMSHELRTPLNSILGFSELLKMNVSGELNEKQARYVDNVITGGSSLIRLIDDILELTRVEAGKMEMKIEKISVPSLVDDSLLLIKENAAVHNIIMEKDLDLELEFIDADRQKVKQVLYNLLSNAVKFSKPRGGTVTIITKQDGSTAKISVADTGIGIKEEDMGRLFQTFEQLDSGIARKYGGTGLGLAISKKLVEMHGGEIKVESRYGEGSTFTFTLPVSAKKEGLI